MLAESGTAVYIVQDYFEWEGAGNLKAYFDKEDAIRYAQKYANELTDQLRDGSDEPENVKGFYEHPDEPRDLGDHYVKIWRDGSDWIAVTKMIVKPRRSVFRNRRRNFRKEFEKKIKKI